MRAAATDMMQGFRYHVTASSNGGATDPLQTTPEADRDKYETKGHAGFQQVTMPELSVEASEYREGIMKWTQKYPGPPTVGEVTLSRGITKRDTAFFDMVMASIEGNEYRADVTIWHYQRTEMGMAQAAETSKTVRRLEAYDCFATMAKPSGDLEAMAGDVSLAEMTLAVEYFDVKYE
jgi:phage tail-like protein